MTDRKIMKAIEHKTFFVHYERSEHRHRLLGEYADHEHALAVAENLVAKYKAKGKPGVITIYTFANRWGLPGVALYDVFILDED